MIIILRWLLSGQYIPNCCRLKNSRTFCKVLVLHSIEFLIITRSLSANGVTSFRGLFYTRFIVTVQPIWDRKYRAWTCSVVEILGLDYTGVTYWTTQQVPNAEQRPLNISGHLGLYLVFKRLKHKSLLRCKASHSHVFFSPHVLWFRAIKSFV